MKPLHTRILNNIKHPIRLAGWLGYQRSRTPDQDMLLTTVTGAGTHWISIMIAKALIDCFGLDEEITAIRVPHLIPTFLDKNQRFKYNHDPSIPRVQHTHSAYMTLMRGRRVAMLMRDLRDAITSHYKVYVRFNQRDDLSFSDFLRGKGIDTSRTHTLQSRIAYLNSWTANRDKLATFKVFRFEDFKHDTAGQLDMLLNHIGLPERSPEQLQRIVDFGSIDNMRRMEAQHPLPQYKNKLNKVRDGQSGGHAAYFSQEDHAYFSDMVTKHLVENYGYDYKKPHGAVPAHA